MDKRSKGIFWLYWLLCLFNIFGWHRLYWRGAKSILFWVYVLFNTIYLILSYIWSKDSGLDISIKLSAILIYGILFVCQILDINLISSKKLQEAEANENSVKQFEVSEEQNQMIELEAEVLPKEECESTDCEDIVHAPTKNKSELSQTQMKTGEEKSQQSLGTELEKTKMLNSVYSSNVIPFPKQSIGGSQEFSQKEENRQINGDLILDLLKGAKKEMTLVEIAKETSYKDIELLQISLDILQISGIDKKQGANGETLYFYSPDS